jgi:hypothetical protein
MTGSLCSNVDRRLASRRATDPGDPDLAAATELAEGSTLRGNVGREEIGGSLMYMLFTHVVKGRLDI